MNKRNYILILIYFFLLSLNGCKKIDDMGYRVFTIKKGNHRSTTNYKTTKTDHLTFKSIFDSSAIYTSIDPINQYDVNKLYGLSDCGCNHSINSIRVGWRWLNDSLEILWFKHMNGNFSFDKITTIDIDKVYDYSISFTDTSYIICVDNICKETTRSCSDNNRRYYLYPYFGGDESAPHDIKIRIQ